jgi:hypothetical protein
LRESPGMPYTRRTPLAIRVSAISSATVDTVSPHAYPGPRR